MAKKLWAWFAVGVMMFGAVGAAEASSFSWLTPNPLDLNTGYAGLTTIGSAFAGYEVTEINKGFPAWQNNSGSTTELNSAPLNTYDILWLYSNGNVSTTFSNASTAVAFSLGGTKSDGATDFYIDNVLITTKDTKNFSGTLLVGGLDNTNHTLTVTGKTHLDGAVNLNQVPLPGAVWLLGSGLAGLLGVRRKKA